MFRGFSMEDYRRMQAAEAEDAKAKAKAAETKAVVNDDYVEHYFSLKLTDVWAGNIIGRHSKGRVRVRVNRDQLKVSVRHWVPKVSSWCSAEWRTRTFTFPGVTVLSRLEELKVETSPLQPWGTSIEVSCRINGQTFKAYSDGVPETERLTAEAV